MSTFLIDVLGLGFVHSPVMFVVEAIRDILGLPSDGHAMPYPRVISTVKYLVY